VRRLAASFLLLLTACQQRNVETVTIATTTSVQDSGLLERLQPVAESRMRAKIRTIAVGSGQALLMAERGEADVVVAHSPEAEEKSVASGHLVERQPLMWNRFLIAGPPEDPAGVRETKSMEDAFRRIRESPGAIFVSRGDESGTHKKEEAIWKAAGLPVKHARVRETGQGIGETLILADELGAYTLTDSSSFSRVRVTRLVTLHGPSLVNPYSVSLVNPVRHPSVNAKGARAFRDWLLGPEAQAIIGSGGLFSLGAPP
jgi:tungstate transport system substrate-binding protein